MGIPFSRHRLAVAGIAIACANSFASAGAAADISFAIPAGPLDQALAAFGERTGLSILYRNVVAHDRMSPGVRGRLTPETAMTSLLAGSGLVARRLNASVFVIEPAAAPVPPAGTDDRDGIVVTGTNIRGGSPIVPVQTITRSDIERSGRTSITGILATLPQNFGGTGTDASFLSGTDRTSRNASLASAPNLRGLGANATLSLINGRRTAGSGARGDFADLSLVPVAAIERIEVLTDGASAIYGSDAVGGVINIILRRDFKGAETRLTGATPTQGGGEHIQFSQTLGEQWGSGHILATYEFDRRSRLRADTRAVTRSADLRPRGGNDWRSPYSVPGTILLPTADGDYTPALAIPATAKNAVLTVADLRPGSNLQDPNPDTDIEPHQTRHAIYLTAAQTISRVLSLYGEFRYAQRRFDYRQPAYATTIAVTSDNPYFLDVDGSGLDIIAYSFARDLGAMRVDGQVRALSATFGTTLDPGAGWRLDLYGTHARERARTATSNYPNEALLAEALGNAPDDPRTSFSTAQDGFFNPFGAGTSNSIPLLDFIDQGLSVQYRRTQMDSVNFTADGPLFRLPAGALRLALGASSRREALSSSALDYSSDTIPQITLGSGGHRRIDAVFGEMRVPIVAPATALPLLYRLDLSAAVRYDRYSDFGHTANPKLALGWSPFNGLDAHVSWGTSYRAPALSEIGDPERVTPLALPDGNGVSTPVLFRVGGNPDLKPERAHSLALGATWHPAFARRLDIGLDYSRIRFTDRIGQPALADIFGALTDPALAPFVTAIDPARNAADLARVQALLASPGAINAGTLPATALRAIVDARQVNASAVLVKALDAHIAYPFDVADGTLRLGLNGSYMLEYREQLTPTAPARDRLGVAGQPARVQGRATTTWSKGPAVLTLAANYASGSRSDTTPGQHAHGWATIDGQIAFVPAGPDRKGLRVALSLDNMFDRAPPFVDRASGIGYDPSRGSLSGRTVSLQVTSRW